MAFVLKPGMRPCGPAAALRNTKSTTTRPAFFGRPQLGSYNKRSLVMLREVLVMAHFGGAMLASNCF